MAAGRWVYIEGNEDKGSGGSPFLMWFIICVVVLSFLYGLICPDYEYYPADGSCDETDWDSVFEMEMTHTDPYCEEESFVYEKWLFSDKISGEIKGYYKREGAVYSINFEGRLDDDILIIELDSMGAIWNNGPTLEVKIIGDTLLKYRGREMVGGRSWFNFPGIY